MRPEPYDKMREDRLTERCPHRRNTGGYCAALDDYIEGADMCELVDKWCLLGSGDTCETYSEFLNEMLKDEKLELRNRSLL